MPGKSPSGPKHTMLTVPAQETTAKNINHEETSLPPRTFDHSLKPFAHFCSPAGNLAPSPECPKAHQLPCRTLLSKTTRPRAIAPGPRLPLTALMIRLAPTSKTLVPLRPERAAALVPPLHLLYSVGLLRSHTKDHGTAWSPPRD
jgi:hypothetical protein